MVRPFRIGRRRVGPGHPMYIIAEMSGNHNGQYARAVRLVKAAAKAGADAVKLQTYTPDTITLKSDRPEFRIGKGTVWRGRTLYDLYGEAMTPWSWTPKLKKLANDLGLDLFSSPFDRSAVDFLVAQGVPAFKIASFEIVDHGLIRYAAQHGKPLIMSTGMATQDEIDAAVRVARKAGARDLALLRCNSAYPAPPSEMDLRTIPDMIRRWDVAVGLSDHTLGISSAVASAALGATILEKHLTLRRSDGGPDAGFSLEPAEFRAMVDGVREAEAALGRIRYGPTKREIPSRVFRRSLFIVRPVKAGERLTETNVRSIRPGHGLPPADLDRVLGKRAARDIEAGTPLRWNLIR